MIYGLRWQFLLSMVIVVLITVETTAFFANRAATAEIERVAGKGRTTRHSANSIFAGCGETSAAG